MDRKIRTSLVVIFSVFFLTMCTFYDQSGAVVSANGLSCQNQTDFVVFKLQQSASCYYQCPDQTIRRPQIAEKFSASSPLYSAAKEDLDAQFCGAALQPAATQPSVTESPIAQASAAPTQEIAATVPSTAQASPAPTGELAATESPSPAQGTSVAGQTPLLTGGVTMCDLAGDLINFRMVEPVPNLINQNLEVQVADRKTSCYINEVNPSLLTCRIPGTVIFPARVVVRLDTAVVNDFTYDGGGCAKLATPLSQ